MPYSRDKLFEFIKQDTLVSLYHNVLLKEKADVIAQTYEHLYGGSIDDVSYVPSTLVVHGQKSEPLHTQVGHDVVQSLGLDFFTNPDLVQKSGILLTSVHCQHPGSKEKITALTRMVDTPVIASFLNVDLANTEVVAFLSDLVHQTPAHMFIGFESQAPVPQLGGVEVLELDTRPRPKMK